MKNFFKATLIAYLTLFPTFIVAPSFAGGCSSHSNKKESTECQNNKQECIKETKKNFNRVEA
tara:strand:- start:198 stop:383 length:186 start_codon:yes stop_codon:yes gene_type:complete